MKNCANLFAPVLASVLALFVCRPALAFQSFSVSTAETETRDLPGGIVFPSFHGAIFENPAALYTGDDVTSIELLYGPPVLGAAQSQYEGSFAMNSSSGWGFGFGYSALSGNDGYVLPSVLNAHAPDGSTVAGSVYGNANYAYAGVGYKLNDLRVGLSYAQPAGGGSYSDSALNFALQFKMSARSYLALVMNSLNNTPNATLGAGIFEDGMYNIEFDVTTPPFSTGLASSTGSNYYFTLNSDVYAGSFGIGFFATYGTTIGGGGSSSSTLDLSYGLSILIKFWKKFDIQARFLTNDVSLLGMDWTF